jgi:uncharacterized phage protein (TIGR02220 family)
LSRYRNIHCLIWNDDKFPFTSDDCKLVWFHLFTTPLTGPIGIHKAPLAGLAEEIRWNLPRYKKAFKEGLGKGFWKYDEKFHVVLFPKFFKHNKPENPNVLKAWIKFYDEIPNCELKLESIQSLKAFAEGWGKPFESLCQTLGVTFPKQEQDQEQYQEQEKDIVPYEEVINYLNQKAGKSFRSVNSNKEHIHARWTEGFRLYDFKRVVDNMVQKWGPDEKMNQYLRPETLFGTKFQSYLNNQPTMFDPIENLKRKQNGNG